MTPSGSIYDSQRLAAAYAFDRPPIHAQIIERVARLLGGTLPRKRALDIGSGVGRSAKALAPVAASVVGIEPSLTMLRQSHIVAPQAHAVAGAAERLPFADASFDLITAAGALNYADLDLFFPEATRVLAADGAIVIYDFSVGKRLRESRQLEHWYASFSQRYPAPPGYALDVPNLAYHRYGLRLCAYETLELALPMTLDSYIRYVLSETGVELAIAGGVPIAEIRAWCHDTLVGIFGASGRDVLFDAYIGYVELGTQRQA
jgi:SAM-dependent methyltransferase